MRALLERYDFDRGVSRVFLSSSRETRVTEVSLWRFASSDGASGMYASWVLSNPPGRSSNWRSSHPLNAGRDAVALVAKKRDGSGFAYAIGTVCVGDVVVHIRYSTRGVLHLGEMRAFVVRSVRALLSPERTGAASA